MEERLNASTDSLPTTIGTGMVTHTVFISTFSLPITICVLGPGSIWRCQKAFKKALPFRVIDVFMEKVKTSIID